MCLAVSRLFLLLLSFAIWAWTGKDGKEGDRQLAEAEVSFASLCVMGA
jgi:hypothetical protein